MISWRRNLYILMISQFLAVGAMSMIIPFLPLYLKNLGVHDEKQIQFLAGIIFGINFFSAFIFSPIWGRLSDRYGRKIMILRSGFGMGIVILFTGLATSPLHLILLRFINGMVSGFIPSSVALVSINTPESRVGYALGMLQSSSVAGIITGPLIGGILAELVGFRLVFFYTSALLILASILVLLFVKENFTPAKNIKSNTFWSEGAYILSNKSLVILFSFAILVQFALLGPAPQIALFVKNLGAPWGYEMLFSGLVIGSSGIANMLSSPVFGKMSDRIGPAKVLFICLIGAFSMLIPHYFVQSVWQLLICRFLLGISLGGIMPALNLIIKESSPKNKIGAVFGYYNSAICLGGMLGPITLGWAANFIGTRGIFIFTAIMLGITAIWLKVIGRRFTKRSMSSS